MRAKPRWSWTNERGELWSQVNYIQYEGRDLEESAWCSMPFHQPDQHTSLYFTIASTVLYFLVPFTIVFVLYLR